MDQERKFAGTKSCHLVCLQKTHDDIPLPDGVTVVIGRSPQTKIVDPRCSRIQVELTADWGKREVTVKQVGGNFSAVDGKVIGPGKTVTAYMESTLFVLTGQYPHQIRFACDSNVKGNESDGIWENMKDLSGHTNSELRKEAHTTSCTNSNSSSSNHEVRISSSKNETAVTSLAISKKRYSSETSGHSHEKKRKKNSEHMKDRDSLGAKEILENRKAASSSSPSTENIQSKSCKLSKLNEAIDEEDEESRMKDIASRIEQMKQKVSLNKDSHSLPSSKLDRQKKRQSDKISECKDIKNAKPCQLPTTASSSSEHSTWTSHEHLYVFTSKGVTHRKKIAGFDIDGTLIVTKSGKTFPTDSSDWKIAYPEAFKKLKELNRNDFKIVCFTNQLGVGRGKLKIEDLKVKIENVISKLQVPVQVFVATHEGKYRKPSDGMWRKLKHDYNAGINIDVKSSLYVGDAAGRPVDWAPKKKKDFSLSDRLFAINVGLKFYTPEEFFLDQKVAPFTMPVFDPRKLRSDASLVADGKMLSSSCKEVVVLVGFPASGKSHLASNFFKAKGYIVVSRDVLGSWQKCVKLTKESLVNSSVVVDNTNLTSEERARYIECAAKAGVPCRCFLLKTTIEHCRHNERFRQLMDPSHAKINEMMFNKIKSRYQEPTVKEGFTQVIPTNFVPKFSSPSAESQYQKFLLEK